MRGRVGLVLCALAVAVVGTVVTVGRADPRPFQADPRTRFEYKVVPGGSINASGQIDAATADQLNKLGADGWELVTVQTSQPPFSATAMYLKRVVKS